MISGAPLTVGSLGGRAQTSQEALAFTLAPGVTSPSRVCCTLDGTTDVPAPFRRRRRTLVLTFAALTAITLPAVNTATAFDGDPDKCLSILRQASIGAPDLANAVAGMGRSTPPAQERNQLMVLVTYRERAGAPVKIVAQYFTEPANGITGKLNGDGPLRARFGNDFSGSGDQLLGILYDCDVDYRGDPTELGLRRRAFESAIHGDTTFLAEQTIEPLRVIAIIPAASVLLPKSIRSRVTAGVLDATLANGQWRGNVRLLTGDSDAADQVANILAAWKDMFGTVANNYGGSDVVDTLRASFNKSVIEVAGTAVQTTTDVPSRVAERAIAKAARWATEHSSAEELSRTAESVP